MRKNRARNTDLCSTHFFTADLVTFTEEILNGKFYFFYAGTPPIDP